MRFYFEAASGVIRVPIEVFGPIRAGVVRMLLDTGAERTAIAIPRLQSLGYQLTSGTAVPIRGVTGAGAAIAMPVARIVLGDIVKHDYSVLAIDLPRWRGADGLLGMDFLAGALVTINTVEGWVEIVDI